MRTIPLKVTEETVTIEGQQKPFKFETVKAIRGAVNQTPQGGFTVDEMMKRQRVLTVLDALQEDATEVNLEDSDYETVKACVSQMKWAFISEAIMDFDKGFRLTKA